MTLLKKTFTLILLVITASSLCKVAISVELQKINFLLSTIEKSEAKFERNGQVHSAQDAKKHLQFKFDRVTKSFFFFGERKDIKAIDFIEKLATASSTTGKPYYIILKNEKKKQELGPWLKAKLKSFKAQK